MEFLSTGWKTVHDISWIFQSKVESNNKPRFFFFILLSFCVALRDPPPPPPTEMMTTKKVLDTHDRVFVWSGAAVCGVEFDVVRKAIEDIFSEELVTRYPSAHVVFLKVLRKTNPDRVC